MRIDNKAQVSMEYLIIVAVLVVITTIIAALGFNLFGLRESIKNHANVFKNKTLDMIG